MEAQADPLSGLTKQGQPETEKQEPKEEEPAPEDQ